MKVDLDVFGKHFVNGVDLLNRLSTIGSGFDVYDWMEEGCCGEETGCNVVRYNGSINWRESTGTKFRRLDDESVTLDRYHGICFFFFGT